ncbi:MAG TPA: hypothetical protein VKT77_09945, partial [Chthonomonadaceae bacterium]|nr:hypothetical protein [Chthonomonadaceae bacterium]
MLVCPRVAAIAAPILGILCLTASPCTAQNAPITRANYALAARWTPAKTSKLLFDNAVIPHWLEFSDRFWYTYDTSRGRMFYLVDPRAKTKKPLFDNAKMAALLTRITLQPYEAQHLPIRTFKFINKDTAIQFELDYSKDDTVFNGESYIKVEDLGKEKGEKEKTDQQQEKDKQTTGAGAPNAAAAKTKSLRFEYDLAAGTLKLVADFTPEPKRPRWASVSPDEKRIVFARDHNLFMMDAANYKLAQKKVDDKSIKETQLTTDGVEYFDYAQTLNDELKKEFQKDEKDRKDYRVPAGGVTWSKDSKKIAVER